MNTSILRITISLILFLVANISFGQNINDAVSTYKANEARFHDEYRGHNLQGVSQVESIKADLLGSGNIFYINLKSNGQNIKCSTSDRETAAKLNKGQIVEYKGIIFDVVNEVLSLEQCKFSPPISKTELNQVINLINSVKKTCSNPTTYKKFLNDDVQFFVRKESNIIIHYQSGARSSDLVAYNLQKDLVVITNLNYSRNNKRINVMRDDLDSILNFFPDSNSCSFSQGLKVEEFFYCKVENKEAKCNWIN